MRHLSRCFRASRRTPSAATSASSSRAISCAAATTTSSSRARTGAPGEVLCPAAPIPRLKRNPARRRRGPAPPARARYKLLLVPRAVSRALAALRRTCRRFFRHLDARRRLASQTYSPPPAPAHHARRRAHELSGRVQLGARRRGRQRAERGAKLRRAALRQGRHPPGSACSASQPFRG